MEKRKVFQWLVRMEATERRQFSEYLRSPLHSHRPQLATMLGHLESTLSSGRPLPNPEFWELVYPDKSYNANLLNRLLSEIMSELRDFFSLVHFKKDLANQQVFLCQELRARAWEDVIPKEINSAEKKLDSEIARDEDYYLAKLQLATERMIYNSDHLGKNPGKIFQPSIDLFETYATLKMLKLKMYSDDHDEKHNAGHRFRLLTSFVEGLKKNGIPNSQLAEMYWLNYKLEREQDSPPLLEEYLAFLKSITPNYRDNARKDILSKMECEDFYNFGFNYCLRLISLGDYSYGKYYLELNTNAFENGIFVTETGYISSQHFIAVLIVFIKIKEFSWIEYFIENHGDMLHPDKKEFTIGYLRAAVLFTKKDFRPAQSKLLKVKSTCTPNTPLTINLNIRQMLCRIFFETKDWQSFIFETNSLNTFVSRNKNFYKSTMTRYSNFTKSIRKLERIIHGPPSKKGLSIGKLKTEITEYQSIMGKPWLLEMIELHK